MQLKEFHVQAPEAIQKGALGRVQVDSATGKQIFEGGGLPMQAYDTLAYPQELTQILARPRAEIYRPKKWRRYLPTQSVQRWAERIEDRKWVAKVDQPVNLSGKGPTEGLPMPQFETSNQFLPLFTFGLAFGYTDEDVAKAAHLGIPLNSENIQACNLGFETFLETVASVGYSVGGGVSLFGLGNLPDVATATAVTKALGGTTWAVATAAEMVEDLGRVVNGVQTASLENSECNRILMDVAHMQLLQRTFTTQNETTAIELFRRIHPGVELATWNPLSNQGAGATPCIMGYDSRDPMGAEMLMRWEVQYGAPHRQINGWVVPASVSTGGVRALNPSAIVKMSGL